jgi:3-hydroxyacyl-CoA dehydrogenase
MPLSPTSTQSPDARAVRRVGIVGAGMMGTAIAAANLRHGLAVVLIDADQQALAAANFRVSRELADLGLTDDEIGQRVGRLLTVGADLDRLGRCDLVLESIVESPAAKQDLLSRLESCLGPGVLLASNTSTIPIAKLSERLQQPGRFLGIHFFYPVSRRPLVEIVRGPCTDWGTVAAAMAHAKAIGKAPIVVADGPGFLVNRLLGPYLAEALELLREGVSVQDLEQAAAEFGMAMGPLRLVDEIGIDTALFGGRVLWEAFPDRITPSPLLVAMYKVGKLGRKTQSGFFTYAANRDSQSPLQPDPDFLKLIAAWSYRPSPTPGIDLMARLLLPMVSEAARILEEGRVEGPESIDLAVNLGLGFPAARGGLLRWADSLGPRRVVSMLESLADRGPRFHPPPLLVAMANADRRFHGPAV